MTVTINGTTGIAGTNGSAGTPAVQGEDTNTGLFFPAADTVAVATGGAERFRVDSSGKVGIGMTPTGTLSIRPSGTGSEDSHIGFGANLDTYITTGANGIVVFREGNGAGVNTERMRIDSSGNLLVGTTSLSSGSSFGFSVQKVGDGAVLLNSRNATVSVNQVAFFNPNGLVGTISTSGSATAYNTSSDYRLKENVAPMQNALDTVAQLNPVTYTWKADGSAGQGFIAHELQAVVPDCVTGEKDAVDAEGNPQYQGVDTSFLVATLVKAIQELTARVAELEAK